MKKHNLDKLFSDKLKGFQSAPASESWEKLEESLNQRPNRAIWTWMSIAASAVLAIVSSVYMLSIDNTPKAYKYSYLENQTENVDVPVEFVFVPVFIQVAESTTPTEKKAAPTQSYVAKENTDNQLQKKEDQQRAVVVANNKVLDHQLTPVIQEPLPLITDSTDDIIIASTKEVEATGSTNTLKPLTIIYKQGEPESKSNFTKAINYMEDVRNGEKKVALFQKIRENIQSKFKSNK